MKTIKRTSAIVMILVMLMSVVSLSAYAANITFTESSLGEAALVPTDSKYKKELNTVHLYGDYDYMFFKGKAYATDVYLFYEICSDKEGTDVIDSGYEYVSNGGTKAPCKITLKGKYKSKTYYMFTYAAKFDSDGKAIVSVKSFRQFKIKVNRKPDFTDNIVVLRSTSNTYNGPRINWYKVSDASKYYIYRREETSTKWKKVGTVSGSKTSFTDTSLKKKNGSYRYTVKAINKKGSASRYINSGIISVFARTPVIKSIAVKYNNAIEIKWGKTSSSAKYDVYRKTDDGSWEKIKSNCTGTSYVDTKVKSNKKYTYTVRAKVQTYFGTATSAYYSNSDKAVTYLRMPTLKDAAAVENGVSISWYKVDGAKGYTIFRKNRDGSTGWSSIGSVGEDVTNFIDTSADTRTDYIYTVRSESSGNKGSYNRTGIEYIYAFLDKPVVAVEPSYSNEIKISWDGVPKSTAYEIYYRVVDGEWELLEVVDDSWWHHLYTLDKYGDYEFKVRAVRNNEIFSEYSDPVFYHQNAMVMCSSVAFTDGIELGWDDHGYESYNIYRRLSTEDESADVLVASVTGNTFKDTTVENDVAYEYKVIGVINGEEQRERVYSITTGIATTIDPPEIPQMRVVENVLYHSNYYDFIYAYNFKYGYWDGISADKTKEYYEDFIKDGKMKFAFSANTHSNLKTPIDNTIIEKEWFDKKIDFTTKVKNNKLIITCKSLSDNIECLWIGSEDLGVATDYYPEGADTITVSLNLPKNKRPEYVDIEIEALTYENDRSTTKAKIKL